jgi:uncharacterized protein YjbJ (UPF0337 family)
MTGTPDKTKNSHARLAGKQKKVIGKLADNKIVKL